MRQINKQYEYELLLLKVKYKNILDEINKISADETKLCILTIIDKFSESKREKIPAEEIKGIINTIYQQYRISETNINNKINETTAYELFFNVSSVGRQSNLVYSLKPAIKEKIETNILKIQDQDLFYEISGENNQPRPKFRSAFYNDIYDAVKEKIKKTEEEKITFNEYQKIVNEQLKIYRKKYENPFFQTNRNVEKALKKFLKIGKYVELIKTNSEDKIEENSENKIKENEKKRRFSKEEKEPVQNGNDFYKRTRRNKILSSYKENNSSDRDSDMPEKKDHENHKNKEGIRYRHNLKSPILFRESRGKSEYNVDIKVETSKNKARKFVFFNKLTKLKNEQLGKKEYSKNSHIKKFIKERYKLTT